MIHKNSPTPSIFVENLLNIEFNQIYNKWLYKYINHKSSLHKGHYLTLCVSSHYFKHLLWKLSWPHLSFSLLGLSLLAMLSSAKQITHSSTSSLRHSSAICVVRFPNSWIHFRAPFTFAISFLICDISIASASFYAFSCAIWSLYC